MAGLYIHIPFCRSKCAYCDFYSLPLKAALSRNNDPDGSRYCRAILNEFRLRHAEISEPFTTIYIGGGTPTALPLPVLLRLLRDLQSEVAAHNASLSGRGNPGLEGNFNPGLSCSKDPGLSESGIPGLEEFTIEANPEDISPEAITALRQNGVNRISIGIQSFDSCQLAEIRRLHPAETSLQALRTLRDSGINYSADLIYGLPGQTLDSWRRQLQELLEFRPPHFSAYLLSYEPGTALTRRLDKGLVSEASEALATRMYEALCNAASAAGYHHYEISNFALPGLEARHNSSYWNLTPYLGLGCSAHSFDGTLRRYNPSDLPLYLHHLAPQPPKSHPVQPPKPSLSPQPSLPQISAVFETEEETPENSANDYIITSLRTTTGLSTDLFKSRWGSTIYASLLANLQPLLSAGAIAIHPSTPLAPLTSPSLTSPHPISAPLTSAPIRFYIPENHWLTADAILREAIL